MISLDNIRNYTRTVYERKLQNVSDKFPNAKIIFMVKDPRAFIATRLRRARSKIHRRRQYFELMELWLKLNKQLIKEGFQAFFLAFDWLTRSKLCFLLTDSPIIKSDASGKDIKLSIGTHQSGVTLCDER